MNFVNNDDLELSRLRFATDFRNNLRGFNMWLNAERQLGKTAADWPALQQGTVSRLRVLNKEAARVHAALQAVGR